MPYCLACGTKTDFETQTCPSCGQAVRHRIEPPGDAFPGPPEPEVPWDEGGDADSGGGDATNGAGDEESKPLAGIDDTLASGENGDGADEDAPPSTDPSGPSPFAGRWSFGVAATYPVEEDYRPLIVGGIVELLALVLPVFSLVTVGYGFRLCGAVARGQRERPAFDDYGESLVGGLQCLLVAGLYGAILAVGGGATAAVWTVDEPLGIALGVTTGVLGLYPFPASLTVYAATGELRTAFSRASTGRFATSGTYVRAWLAWIAGIVAVAVAAVLSVITLVGPVVVRAWGTYSLGVLWGYYYRQAAAEGVVPTAPDEPVR
ncbi:DUF4013 domain-containing protein [Halomicrobium mukohataei]|uniref:DUF4013 domain-containing protein n=2 Tax=Halomicrobium mukohataei TaxID=57705 RepID=C7P220_HALMD|nr:DUF4013 domain-containing protein [Halomicrobium mukohataei]ACV47249.1 hypothetical protein Hmuk_1123 [Halomicrobium mukohataei DSM 12286]QCD65722.1 DUF4013 domain-containing protein [Halomicrobium mukohataei]